MTASDARSSIGVRKDGRGKALERQFYVAACLAMSIIDRFPEAQVEALTLRLPHLLWKVGWAYIYNIYLYARFR